MECSNNDIRSIYEPTNTLPSHKSMPCLGGLKQILGSIFARRDISHNSSYKFLFNLVDATYLLSRSLVGVASTSTWDHSGAVFGLIQVKPSLTQKTLYQHCQTSYIQQEAYTLHHYHCLFPTVEFKGQRESLVLSEKLVWY